MNTEGELLWLRATKLEVYFFAFTSTLCQLWAKSAYRIQREEIYQSLEEEDSENVVGERMSRFFFFFFLQCLADPNLLNRPAKRDSSFGAGLRGGR